MKKRTVATAIVAAAVLGIGAVAYAANQPSDPTTTPPPSSSQPSQQGQPGQPGQQAKRPHRVGGLGHRLGRNAVHVEAKVKQGNDFVTYTLDRGSVTAVSETSITVHRADGTDVTETITKDTKFRGATSWDQVRKGQPALLVSKDGGDGHSAAAVVQPTAEQQQRIQQRIERFKSRHGNVPGGSGVVPDEDQVPAA